MVPVLAGRGFGDVDVDAVVMVALLGAFGALHVARPPSTLPRTCSNAGCWAVPGSGRNRDLSKVATVAFFDHHRRSTCISSVVQDMPDLVSI